MIYSTIIKGKYAGISIVFPPGWKNERTASVLSALNACLTVSAPYIMTDSGEIANMYARAIDLLDGEEPSEAHSLHFVSPVLPSL